MRIEVGKKELFILVMLIVGIAGAAEVMAVWDKDKTVFHSASDVKIKVANSYFSLQEAFDSDIIMHRSKIIWSETNIKTSQWRTQIGKDDIEECDGTGCFLEVKGFDATGSPFLYNIFLEYIKNPDWIIFNGLGNSALVQTQKCNMHNSISDCSLNLGQLEIGDCNINYLTGACVKTSDDRFFVNIATNVNVTNAYLIKI